MVRKKKRKRRIESYFFYCSLGYGLTPHSLDSDEKQVRFYHIVNEVFKFAYAKRSAMGDEYDSQTEKNASIEKVNQSVGFFFYIDAKFNLVINLMLMKFVRELMNKKLNHWNIMNQSLNHKQVFIENNFIFIREFFVERSWN